MGKTEKIVVLSVLFAVVVLFVWSLQADGVDAKTNNEGAAASNEGATAPRKTPRESTGPGRRGDVEPSGPDLSPRGEGGAEVAVAGPGRIDLLDPGSLLSSEVTPGGTPARPSPGPSSGSAIDDAIAPRPVRMQPGWDLVTTAGLEATVDPRMLIMRPEPGSTWESVALDLYGDESKARLLRHNNEGMVAPGALILVPAKDDLGAAGDVRIVEVLEGESLWGVATRELGNGARWKEIFEANRDVITDPDFVAPGVRLKIPSDG